ncbi:SH3 domain-containing kinase-binding protein 1 [Eupeodes corollae]|uniref:SH3 domain-containing kinase-binding protein 1 n=1 Tax=Eupeodes corollae TaxID=290404 RepID=UPI00249044FC|nr:SH3 domain-containing kinase-binding protein 1 [Eupeodes corollae]
MEHSCADYKQRVTAIAEYDYWAKEDDEIDLLKGQELKNITQKPGGWWEGTICSTGKRGMFPDNFVRVIENFDNNMVVLREKSLTVQRRCKAIYSYTQVNEDELSLAVGDVIDFLTEVEEGWWRGRLNNKVGVFPSNFVVVLPSTPIDVNQGPNSNQDSNISQPKRIKSSNITKRHQISCDENALEGRTIDISVNKSTDENLVPEIPPKPIKEYCRVEFPYSPENDDELVLVIGQIITIVDKDLPDKGWWKGEINGKVGVFPDNFVKLLPNGVTLEKDTKTPQTKQSSNETLKKNGEFPSSSKGLKASCLHEELLIRPNLEGEGISAQRMSLDSLTFANLTNSSSSDRKNENFELKAEEDKRRGYSDEKKAPPPHPNKKATIIVKKSIANVTGLRHKIKNADHKTTFHQDSNDSSQSIEFSYETKSKEEKTASFDEIHGNNSEFDKVQRTSILSDIRARRVKAPKRRPPSSSTNLTPLNSVTVNLINDKNVGFNELENNETASFIVEQIKTTNLDWEVQKLPWIEELKASQIKTKSLPFIEPRTTLVKLNNEVNTAVQSPSNVSSKALKAEIDGSLFKENGIVKSSSLLQLWEDLNIESEADIKKTGSDITINDELLRDQFKDIEHKNSHSKMNEMRFEMEKTKSPSSNNTQEKTIIELEKRVQRLEVNVQMQKTLIEDLVRMLQHESNRVQLLKNQLDECVTKVECSNKNM